MNQKLSAIVILLGLVSLGTASPMFLVEDFGDNPVVVTNTSTKLNELEFSITSPAYVMISSSELSGIDQGGGTEVSCHFYTWVLINDDTLYESWCHPLCMTWLTQGTYVLESWAVTDTLVSPQPPSLLEDGFPLPHPLFQVMIFLEDSTGSVNEPPLGNNNPVANPRGILATGNIVHVEGCSQIYDISGQKVDCSVSNGDIELNRLPAGTYYAHGSSGSTTKIVKSY